MADSTADSTQSDESENSNSENRTMLCSNMPQPLGSRGESEAPSSTTNGSPSGALQSGASPTSSSPQRNGGSSPQTHKLNMYRPGFTAFGGSGVNQGAFSNNPFAPRPGLRTDVVSTSHHPCNAPAEPAMIAPSRFGNPFMMRHADSDTEEEHGRRAPFLAQPRLTSVLAPSRLQLRPPAFTLRGDPPSTHQFASPILKPATLPDPTKQPAGKPEGGKEAGKTSSDEVHSMVSEGASQGTEASACDGPESSISPSSATKPADDAAASGKENIGDGGKNASPGFLFGECLSERVSNVGASQNAGFVFGENLADRVVQSSVPSESEDEKYNSDDQKSDAAKTLEESAREYQARHEVKTELKEVEVKTGEEEESNVLQAACKLFVFDGKDQRWVERGRGTLRLNDMVSTKDEFFQSRLVMRTQGSLRVILNTKIWSGMMVERANTKSLRITATDVGGDGIKVFLLMTNPNDNENILRAIDWRIQRLKCVEEKERHSEEGRRVAEKRHADSSDMDSPPKRHKRVGEVDGAAGHIRREESDSSVQDPETEASCESYSSSFTVRSESE